MRHMVAMVTGFVEKYNGICLFHYCGKFHIGTMNQTVLRREFVKLV